ncbi:MAG: hypothetical protein IAF38_02185 [Bacteroidia bacterium]|nr:hypothetical protein [Bacteroidia bacterium]
MKTYLLLACFFLFTGNFYLNAQENKQGAAQSPTSEKKILYYSFSGANSVAELETLKNEILLVENVKEIKTECKAEKKLAQFRIVFFEKRKTSEGDKEFDIAAIKKLILKYQYVPGDFKIEPAE